jgi:hypothetical protein
MRFEALTSTFSPAIPAERVAGPVALGWTLMMSVRRRSGIGAPQPWQLARSEAVGKEQRSQVTRRDSSGIDPSGAQSRCYKTKLSARSERGNAPA